MKFLDDNVDAFPGNGYVRSEGVVAVFIQKKHVAKRSYAGVVGILDNSNGMHEGGEDNENYDYYL